MFIINILPSYLDASIRTTKKYILCKINYILLLYINIIIYLWNINVCINIYNIDIILSIIINIYYIMNIIINQTHSINFNDILCIYNIENKYTNSYVTYLFHLMWVLSGLSVFVWNRVKYLYIIIFICLMFLIVLEYL